jgi:type II secretory pathway component PulC
MNSKRILVFGNFLVLVIVFWMSASIVLTWVSHRRTRDFLKGDSPVPPTSRRAVPRQNKTMADYAAISEKNIFRTPKEISKGAAGEDGDINVTELNLELKGTVMGEGRKSYAVIVDRDSSKEDVYFQDDFVMGARIAKIMKSKVILNFNGEEEALLMIDESRALPELGSSSQPRPAPRILTPLRRVITPRSGVTRPNR